MRDTVVEVDLDRIAFNVRQIKGYGRSGHPGGGSGEGGRLGHGARALRLPSWKTSLPAASGPPCPRQWS